MSGGDQLQITAMMINYRLQITVAPGSYYVDSLLDASPCNEDDYIVMLRYVVMAS